jgi:excisionase family DNA binding protein
MDKRGAKMNVMELQDIACDEGERFLSRQHVARILDCSVETVGRRIKSGNLKSVKLGRLVRIPASEIARLTSNIAQADVS